MVGDVLKNLVIGLIALVLIVAGGFYIKISRKRRDCRRCSGSKVGCFKWKGNEKVDIVFQLLNNKNNEIRGVNDQMRAVIVDGQLKTYNKLNPHLQERVI